jgi:hypothetical protein
MSDSNYCYVHWRDADLINVGLDWELEDLPNDRTLTSPCR